MALLVVLIRSLRLIILPHEHLRVIQHFVFKSLEEIINSVILGTQLLNLIIRYTYDTGD
jgi:hypothetical protein